MRPKIKISIILFGLLVIFAGRTSGQVDVMANYIFSEDSVSGFDETAATAAAFRNSSFGFEYKVFMYMAKRDFIKQKYNLKTVAVKAPLTLFQNQTLSKTTAIGGTCDNEDFELATTQINGPGAVQGWTCYSGTNPNSCLPPTIPMPNSMMNYTVFAGPTIDPKIGAPVASYFDAGSNITPSGNCFIRLNNAAAGGKALKLSKSFIVTPGNALFQYAYLPVINASPHECCDQPGFNIHITVTNTLSNQSSVLACPQISIAVPSAACAFVPPVGSPVFSLCPLDQLWTYHNWNASAIDLTAYIGNLVTLDVVVVDCNQGGHGAYSYFDAKCAPMTVLGNTTPFPAGTPNFTLPTCGAQSATICAPDGLGPYSWGGPGVVAPYNTPLMSNQCFTAGLSALFTLTMNPPGSCNPIVRNITVTITPAPYILAQVNQAVCGGTLAVVGYTAAGSASVNPTIIWNPVPTATTSNNVNLGTATFTTGTGVVTVTALDPLGCKVTATVNILPSPPTPTGTIFNITGSQSITCITPSVSLAVSTTYTNPLTYFWSSNSFTANTQTITVVGASTLITVVFTDTFTGCSNSATTTVKVNTVIPISSVNPVNQSVNCGPGVVATATGVAISPTVNVTHFWYAPGQPAPYVYGGGVTSIYNPIVGTSTYVLVDLVNGCTTTKTIQVVSTGGNFPTFSVTSAGSNNTFTLGCSTRSVTDLVIAGGNSVPPGGVISYTLLPPAFTGTNYLTSVTVSNYTVNYPGTYTVIVRDNGNLCETRLMLSVLQNTFGPDIVAVVPTRTLDCFTPSMTLHGVSATPNVTYSWLKSSIPPLISDSLLNVSTTVAGASVPSATVIDNYTLTIIDKSQYGNYCPSTSVVTIYQNVRPPKPGIAFTFTALTCAIFSVNATNNSTTGVLPGTFFGTGNLNAILWTGPSPQKIVTNSSTYLAFTPGTYSMTVMDMNNGCTSLTTAVLGDTRVYPTINTNTQVPLDCGAGSGGVKLAAQALGLSSSAVDALWTVPINTAPNTSALNSLTITTDGVGDYILTVTTKTNGCSRQAVVEVINGSLTANFTADQTTGYAPLTVNFENNSASTSTATGSYSITSVWSYGNGTTKTTTTTTTKSPGTSAVYTQPGTYTVTMFAVKGSCRDTFVTVIKVDIPSKLEIPNVFTPNGDNSNDIFFVRTANLAEISATIYDRWGNKIYELATGKGNIAWDGKSNTGKDAPDGTYFYIITATGKDGVTYDTKGTVSLYR